MHVCVNIGVLFPYNEGNICIVNTSANRGDHLKMLDGINCSEYKLDPNNDGSSGVIPLSARFTIFRRTHDYAIVRIKYFVYVRMCVVVHVTVNLHK